MKQSIQEETERYYRAYQRAIALSLAFAISIGAYFLANILGYVDSGGLIISGLYAAALLALKVSTSGVRSWGRRDPFLRAIFRDEWSGATRNRASRTAFAVTLWSQVPLAFFMESVPPEPSVGGMGALTMALGLSAFFGGYLYYGRQPSHG